MALSDNLISAWELDEASGSALDSHGSNDLAETSGTIGTGTGLIYGSARDFEVGDTEWFTLADNADLSTGDIDFTFEAWVKVESLDTFRAVFGKDGGGQKEYTCYIYPNGNIQFNVSNNGVNEHGTVTFGAGSITAGNWAQIICGHDSVNNQTFLTINNGALATVSYSGGVQNGTAAFQIGALDFGGQLPFDGLIGPVRFWKRVLTSDERTELYNAGAGRDYDYITGGAAPTGNRRRRALICGAAA